MDCSSCLASCKCVEYLKLWTTVFSLWFVCVVVVVAAAAAAAVVVVAVVVLCCCCCFTLHMTSLQDTAGKPVRHPTYNTIVHVSQVIEQSC